MSDLSVSKRDHNQQLEDLKQEHEKKLQAVKADFRRRETELRESGEAAVNHIKSSINERVKIARNEGEDRANRETENINRSYSDLKRKASHLHQSLEMQEEETRERIQRSIASTRAEESKKIEQSQEKLRQFLQKQEEVKKASRENVNRDLQLIQKTGTDEGRRTREKNMQEVRLLNEQHQNNVTKLRDDSRTLYSESQKESQQRLAQLRDENSKKLEAERELGHRSLARTRDKYKGTITNEVRDGEARLSAVKQENQRKLEADRDRAIKTNEDVQAAYSSETQRVQVKGETEVKASEKKFTELVKRTELEGQEKLKESEVELSEREKKQRLEYETRIQTESQKIDEALHRQRSEFQKRYDLNDKVQRETFGNQKENYLKELYKQKMRMDEKMGVENARKNDSFYKMKSFNAKLTEEPGGYVLEAKVPAHDKKNVSVRVQDDKVTLSAKRAHVDEFKDEQSRTSTNSYQTYRQDFKLDIPVANKHAITKIGDDGTISVFVPKRGHLLNKG